MTRSKLARAATAQRLLGFKDFLTDAAYAALVVAALMVAVWYATAP